MVRSVRALEGVSVPSMVLAFSAALHSSCSFGLVLALRMAIGLLDGRRHKIPSRVRTWSRGCCLSLAMSGGLAGFGDRPACQTNIVLVFLIQCRVLSHLAGGSARIGTSVTGKTVLPNLTAEDLKDLGVSALGHRRKLLDAIAALRSTPR